MIVPKRQHRRGRGFLNKVINSLPFELHIPGYQYCGPGTKLAKRLARGDPGINLPDKAYKEHDITYSQNRENVKGRNAADKVLAEKAQQRVKSKDASICEKAAAFTDSKAMKLKSTFGMGMRKKKKGGVITFNNVVKAATKSIVPSKCARKVILSGLKGARKAVSRVKV